MSFPSNYICLSVAVSTGERPSLFGVCVSQKCDHPLHNNAHHRAICQTYMYSWGHQGFGSLSFQPFIGLGVHSALTSPPNECSNLQIVTQDLGCYMVINICGRISSTGFIFNVGCFQLNLFLQICFCKHETILKDYSSQANTNSNLFPLDSAAEVVPPCHPGWENME